DLAGHARDFRGERVELIHHSVDGVLQLENLTLHVHRDLLREVAVGHGGRHFGDVAHLTGQVAGHEVDVVGQVFPGSAYAAHISLAAELSFGADLAGHARDFRGERVELIHHSVAHLFDLENLTLHVHGDLLREVAVGHGGGSEERGGGLECE